MCKIIFFFLLALLSGGGTYAAHRLIVRSAAEKVNILAVNGYLNKMAESSFENSFAVRLQGGCLGFLIGGGLGALMGSRNDSQIGTYTVIGAFGGMAVDAFCGGETMGFLNGFAALGGAFSAIFAYKILNGIIQREFEERLEEPRREDGA